MSLIYVEPQPKFPMLDISDNAAADLELYLSNRDIVERFHESAEHRPLYKHGHEAFDGIARQQLSADQAAAFSYGITTYEALSAFVHPGKTEEETTKLQIASAAYDISKVFEKKREGLEEASNQFRNDLPRSHYVIGESAARFYGSNELYALSGAAFARELEIRTISR